jgi:eukaryotic-like serine/threonine-protein kinase
VIRVGSYELVELIGEGATGAVHRARDGEGTEVAVKLMRAEYANEAVVRARFLREARITGEIASPHVVQVFEAGDDGETAYLVMPLYVGGRPLRPPSRSRNRRGMRGRPRR